MGIAGMQGLCAVSSISLVPQILLTVIYYCGKPDCTIALGSLYGVNANIRNHIYLLSTRLVVW